MTHLDSFMKMLKEQKDIKETNWQDKQIQYKSEITADGDISIKIKEDEVSFLFDIDGQFIGICNYKE
jgi:hypothetical protein